MAPDHYRLSFTTGGLFRLEAPLVAKHYLDTYDWVETRSHVREANMLQVRTAAAALRVSKEVIARLEQLSDKELAFLVDGSPHGVSQLMWVAACRRYAFIAEFAREVVRERALLLQRQLAYGDFDAFFNAKALWHVELDQLADSTRHKLRQNLFRMLREADIITDKHLIQPAVLSPELARLLAGRGEDQLLMFPATDREIKGWLS